MCFLGSFKLQTVVYSSIKNVSVYKTNSKDVLKDAETKLPEVQIMQSG